MLRTVNRLSILSISSSLYLENRIGSMASNDNLLWASLIMELTRLHLPFLPYCIPPGKMGLPGPFQKPISGTRVLGPTANLLLAKWWRCCLCFCQLWVPLSFSISLSKWACDFQHGTPKNLKSRKYKACTNYSNVKYPLNRLKYVN